MFLSLTWVIIHLLHFPKRFLLNSRLQFQNTISQICKWNIAIFIHFVHIITLSAPERTDPSFHRHHFHLSYFNHPCIILCLIMYLSFRLLVSLLRHSLTWPFPKFKDTTVLLENNLPPSISFIYSGNNSMVHSFKAAICLGS